LHGVFGTFTALAAHHRNGLTRTFQPWGQQKTRPLLAPGVHSDHHEIYTRIDQIRQADNRPNLKAVGTKEAMRQLQEGSPKQSLGSKTSSDHRRQAGNGLRFVPR
jgi:hypothetical protein